MDKFKRGRNIYYIKTHLRKAYLAMLLSGKADFGAKAITVDRMFMILKGQFTWKMTAIPHVYAPDNSHKFR